MDLAAPKGIELWKKKTTILLLASSYFCFWASSTVGYPLGEGRGNNKDGQVLPFRPLNIHGRAIFLTLCFCTGDYISVLYLSQVKLHPNLPSGCINKHAIFPTCISSSRGVARKFCLWGQVATLTYLSRQPHTHT